MPDHPGLVSIIMPAYNSERTIEAAVMSVIEQTCRNWELIIVDDASQDRTAEICSSVAERDSRVKVITNQINLGILQSRIKAVEAACGDWIAFLDSDDLWQPEKLYKQIALRDKTGCDLVYTGSGFMDVDGKKYEWTMHVPSQVKYRTLLKQNIISNSSVLMRKQDFLRFSPPDEIDGDMHEDFACWLGMLRTGLLACGIDEPLLTYRISSRSATGNKVSAAKLNLNTYRYIGLGFFERCYYQTCYAINGIRKHRHFR